MLMEEPVGDAGRTSVPVSVSVSVSGPVPEPEIEPQQPEPALIASSSSLRERSRVSRTSSRNSLSSSSNNDSSRERRRRRQSTGSTTLATPGSQHHDHHEHDNDNDHAFELQDLHHIPTYPGDRARDSSPSTISSGSLRIVTRRSTRSSQMTSRSREPTGRFRHVIKFWRRHVVLSVPQSQKRDHYALERTYLAHMRTSLAFSLLGVLIAQLFSLQHSHFHDTSFGFYKVGVPLGCACQGCAILVGFFGACRFIRQQKAISRGKIHAGGWEVMVLAGLTVGIILTLLVLVIVISVRRDSAY